MIMLFSNKKYRTKIEHPPLSSQAFSALRNANMCGFASENSIITLRIHCKKLDVYRFNILRCMNDENVIFL